MIKKRRYEQGRWQVLRASVAVLVAAGLGGCALGPDFKTPGAPATGNSYTPTPLPSQTASAPGLGGASQQFAFGQDIQADWWTVFRSPALDQLIRSALQQNPNMAAAEAALRQAQESYNAQYGSTVYPSVTGQLGVAREKVTAATAGPAAGVFNLYNASVNVSYALDVAGIDVIRTRTIAVLTTGALAGLGGAYLANVGAGLFIPFITNGAGFLGIVLAMLARGRPVWVLFGALLFGVCLSLTTAMQVAGINIPTDIIQMLPFLAVMIMLVLFGRRASLPAALGIPYERGAR